MSHHRSMCASAIRICCTHWLATEMGALQSKRPPVCPPTSHRILRQSPARNRVMALRTTPACASFALGKLRRRRCSTLPVWLSVLLHSLHILISKTRAHFTVDADAIVVVGVFFLDFQIDFSFCLVGGHWRCEGADQYSSTCAGDNEQS